MTKLIDRRRVACGGLAAACLGPWLWGVAAADPAPSTGSIQGRVRFVGQAPPQPLIDRHSDPYCAQTPKVDESVVVNPNRTLKDVLVRLAGTLPQPPPPPAAPVVIEQRECTYVPRVQGLQAGQRLEVRNRDGTLHNVHAYRGAQTVLNRSQKEGSGPVGAQVQGPPALLEVKCDVHPWMIGHVWVSPHPWFAVTDDQGRFEIGQVPAGHFQIEAWHQVYGTRAVDVDVPAGGTARVDLVLGPPRAGAGR